MPMLVSCPTSLTLPCTPTTAFSRNNSTVTAGLVRAETADVGGFRRQQHDTYMMNEWLGVAFTALTALGSGSRRHVSAYAERGSSFGNRIKLKAALAKTKSQSTLGSPRSFTLRIQAMVFSHPNAGSIRGRAC